jgi:MoaA/NifB/PqqE/SkfB family radical SAM enzyme
LFRKIAPAFDKTKLVYLQGWGEPFTHPQFVDFLRLAKRTGCRVGTTTNGALLDSNTIEKLVDEGLDILCFSLAGVDEKNDNIRIGTRIRNVLDCIQTVHRVKSSRSADNPRIHLAYMLLRSGLPDLDRLPEFTANAGISQTVVSSLSLVVNPEMERGAMLASGEAEWRAVMEKLDRVREAAKTRGSDLFFNVVSPLKEASCCSENVGRALVVGSNGDISPCVMARIPVTGDNYQYVWGNRRPVRHVGFGNIADKPLHLIWHSKAYKRFVRRRLLGKQVSFCQPCLKRFHTTL